MAINEMTDQLKAEIYGVAAISTVGSIHAERIKERDKALDALDYLQDKGFIDKDFPPIKSIKDVSRIIDIKSLVETIERSLISILQDQSMERGLSITPTSRCDNHCAHCETESTGKGEDLDFRLLEDADPNFLKLFQIAHFSFEGDCLLVRSKNKQGQMMDLSDYISLLYNYGVRQFVMVTKKLSDEKVYGKIQSFFQSTLDATLTQRISFNLYSPEIFGKRESLDGLKREFLPLFYAAMQTADNIRLNVNGSFKYERSDAGRSRGLS